MEGLHSYVAYLLEETFFLPVFAFIPFGPTSIALLICGISGNPLTLSPMKEETSRGKKIAFNLVFGSVVLFLISAFAITADVPVPHKWIIWLFVGSLIFGTFMAVIFITAERKSKSRNSQLE